MNDRMPGNMPGNGKEKMMNDRMPGREIPLEKNPTTGSYSAANSGSRGKGSKPKWMTTVEEKFDQFCSIIAWFLVSLSQRILYLISPEGVALCGTVLGAIALLYSIQNWGFLLDPDMRFLPSLAGTTPEGDLRRLVPTFLPNSLFWVCNFVGGLLGLNPRLPYMEFETLWTKPAWYMAILIAGGVTYLQGMSLRAVRLGTQREAITLARNVDTQLRTLDQIASDGGAFQKSVAFQSRVAVNTNALFLGVASFLSVVFEVCYLFIGNAPKGCPWYLSIVVAMIISIMPELTLVSRTTKSTAK